MYPQSLSALMPINQPPPAKPLPKLRPGSTYQVMLQNLQRLLLLGWKLEEAKAVVLSNAGVEYFPNPNGQLSLTSSATPGPGDTPATKLAS